MICLALDTPVQTPFKHRERVTARHRFEWRLIVKVEINRFLERILVPAVLCHCRLPNRMALSCRPANKRLLENPVTVVPPNPATVIADNPATVVLANLPTMASAAATIRWGAAIPVVETTIEAGPAGNAQ